MSFIKKYRYAIIERENSRGQKIYAVRRQAYLFQSYKQYVDLRSRGEFWWSPSAMYFDDCFTTDYSIAEEMYEAVKDGYKNKKNRIARRLKDRVLSEEELLNRYEEVADLHDIEERLERLGVG